MMMQREPIGMFSTRSYWPPTALRAAARSCARFCPSAVTAGILPVGGSTISDVRRLREYTDWLRSRPNWVKS